MPRDFRDLTLRQSCTRVLGGHGRMDARRWATRLLESASIDDPLDIYSEGAAMQRLEAETAALLLDIARGSPGVIPARNESGFEPYSAQGIAARYARLFDKVATK